MTRLKLALVLLIFSLAFILKINNYATYPQRGASSDEYTYSFLGISLIKDHIPTSWSYFEYNNRYDLTINKLYFPIVHPYFDHPPLNGLLVGGFSILFGQDTFQKVDLKTIRLVPILLSMVSSLLVFLIGKKLFDYKTSIWALLIYTTTTIFVMNTRVVFAENLLTTLFLLTLYFFILNAKNITYKKTIIIGILSGLSFLTKELGAVVFISLFYLFFENKVKFKKILILTLVFFAFVASYLIYGAYYDWEIFKKIISVQSNRLIGPESLQMLLSTPIIVNKVYFDGWYFFGFFSLFFSFFEFKKYKMLIVPSAAYFMLLIFSVATDNQLGWYTIPLFPFMSLLSASLLVESLKKQSWFIFILLIFVGLYEIRYIYEASFGLTPEQFRIMLFIMFFPFIFLLLLQKEKLFYYLSNFWFYLLILGNIFLTYSYIHPA